MSDPDPGEEAGPVPEANQPGHHPEHEQDQPDLYEFAQRLGAVPPQPEVEVVLEVEPEPERPRLEVVAPQDRGGCLGRVLGLAARRVGLSP